MKIKRYLALVAGAMLFCTSCVNDLDTLPLNHWDAIAENVYGAEEEAYIQGMGRIYKMLNSHNLTDMKDVDGGASETIRAFWNCQETTTDACKVAWKDPWSESVNTNTWTTANNDVITGIYLRAMQSISYANEYLAQTTGDKLNERGVASDVQERIQGYRAEVRFLRAYYYWIMCDIFGAVPFSTENDLVGSTLPQQSRSFIYNFIVSELEALAADGSAMPVERNYPRADKGAVLGLLARVYLNAEVYSGEAQWLKCQQTCEKLFNMNRYKLCPEYADLFRGDNGQNPDALQELIFAIEYDWDYAQSYGGTTFLIQAGQASTDPGNFGYQLGLKGGWGGIRTTYEYAKMYFDVKDIDWENGTYTCDDKRGQFFWLKDKVDDEAQEKIDNGELKIEDVILRESSMKADLFQFKYGWTCWKFNNIPHDMTAEEYAPIGKEKEFSNIDFPVIRLAEIYLIYAEACRELGETSKGLPYLAELAQRAGVAAPTAAEVEADVQVEAVSDDGDFRASVDWFIAERARELMWEGHRRTDLVRHNLYHSDAYLWPYKGGLSFNGQGFAEEREVFLLPASQIVVYPGGGLTNPY